MLKTTQKMLIIFVLFLSACTPAPAPRAVVTTMPEPEPTDTQPAAPHAPTAVLTAVPTPAAQIDEQPLAALKGKLVKDRDTFLLLLGIGPVTNPERNYQFTEGYHFPHDHINQDFRLIDSKGDVLDFEEMDPFESNLFNEEPLGPGISDPRVFRFSLTGASGPLTLEVVNMVKGVTLVTPLPEKIKLKFDAGFPLGKQKWDIEQPVQIIPGAPFTIKYYQPIGFNTTRWCNEDIKTYFRGTFYLDAPDYEYIQFTQSVPPERKSEFPLCGGGSGDHICSDYAACVISDTDMITMADPQYELQISAYTRVIHGPWRVQFDLPE
jgi:hypothetical protein